MIGLRLLEHVHGHLGWLAVVALLHPAILLRNPRRRAPLAVGLTTALVTLVAAMGAGIYPAYRFYLRQPLFQEAAWIGWSFERKEHLAVGALVFCWVGCIAHLAGERFATLAHRAFVAAALFALGSAGIGTFVASVKTF